MRVLILTHADLLPPDKAKPCELEDAPWKAEYDVIHALKASGHDVQTLGLLEDLSPIEVCLTEWRPHITFNLMEEFNGVSKFDQNVVSYLELRNQRYTGCNPRGLMLSRNKGLAKKILAYHGIQTPKFAVFPRGQGIRRPKDLAFPLIVKSLTEEASLGISGASVVRDEPRLIERIQYIHREIETDAIVESYIEGRELYVGVLGNARPETLPVWELFLSGVPRQCPRIATERVKWDSTYRKRYQIKSSRAKGLSAELTAKAQELAKKVYSALGLNGYARMDLRLTEAGEIYFIESNPNPHIGDNEDFADSAKDAGLTYEALVSKIVSLGLRWQPTK